MNKDAMNRVSTKNGLIMVDKFQNLYRIPSARAAW